MAVLVRGGPQIKLELYQWLIRRMFLAYIRQCLHHPFIDILIAKNLLEILILADKNEGKSCTYIFKVLLSMNKYCLLRVIVH